MKAPKLPKAKRLPGLYLYCPTHKKYFRDDSKRTCCNKVVYKAKVHVPGSKTVHDSNSRNRTKTKILHTTDFNDAIALFAAFKKWLKESNYINHILEKDSSKPTLIVDCFASFVAYLNNEGVPEHEKRFRDRKVIRNYERAFELFLTSLKKASPPVDVKNLKFTDINDVMIGYYHTYLLHERNYANKSYNSTMLTLKSFFAYVVRKFYPTHVHPLVNFKKRKVILKKDSISEQEFLRTLDAVTEANSRREKGHRKRAKNMYRPWMRDAFILGFLSGGRKKEITHGRWCDIVCDENGNPLYIEAKNFKETAANQHLLKDDEFIPKPVLITPVFEKFLRDLGFEKKRNSPDFIIAPNYEGNRFTMNELIGAAFPHYFAIANKVRKEFKLLRKTYATYLKLHFGDQAASLFGDLESTMDTHYVHAARLAEDLSKKLRQENHKSPLELKSLRSPDNTSQTHQ